VGDAVEEDQGQDVLLSEGVLSSLYCGVFDWERPEWVGCFYPDDLPVEWRTGYYSNHFSAVLIPELRWRQASRVEVEAWCEELGEHGVVLLEVTLRPDSIEALLALMAVDALSLDGVVLRGAFDVALVERLRSQLPRLPRYLVETEGVASATLQRYHLLPVWRGGSALSVSTNLALLAGGDEPPAVRAKIVGEFLQQAQNWRSAVVIIEGGDLLLQLRELEALAELYGL